MSQFVTLLALASLSHVQASPTHDLIELEQLRLQEYRKIQAIRNRLLLTDPNASAATLMMDRDVKAMGLNGSPQQTYQTIQQALNYRFDLGSLSEYHPIDFNSNDPVLTYTVARVDDKGLPKFSTLKEGLAGKKMSIFKVQVTQTPLPVPEQKVDLTPTVQSAYMGPFVKEDLVKELSYFDQHSSQGKAVRTKSEILPDSEIPVELYDDAQGHVAVVLDHAPDKPLVFPDTPELPLFKAPVPEIQKAYDTKNTDKTPLVRPLLAVKQDGQVIDFEHVKRQNCLALQQLRDKVAAAHPSSAQYPPEMLTTPEFKATGLELPRDQQVMVTALAYRPEDQPLHGFRPIDFDKDKASNYTVITAGPSGTGVARTLKDAFQNKHVLLIKLRVKRAANAAPTIGADEEVFYGPITHEAFEAASKTLTGVQEVSDQDVPISVYTNDSGAVAFVLASAPAKVLSVPPSPMLGVFADPVATIQDAIDHKAPKGFAPHPVIDVTFAVAKS
jgi:hypothetical protein